MVNTVVFYYSRLLIEQSVKESRDIWWSIAISAPNSFGTVTHMASALQHRHTHASCSTVTHMPPAAPSHTYILQHHHRHASCSAVTHMPPSARQTHAPCSTVTHMVPAAPSSTYLLQHRNTHTVEADCVTRNIDRCKYVFFLNGKFY